MNCPSCGEKLPRRPRTRMALNGIVLIIAAFVLLLFVHLAVVVLACVLMAVVGAASLKAAFVAGPMRCRKCRKLPVRSG